MILFGWGGGGWDVVVVRVLDDRCSGGLSLGIVCSCSIFWGRWVKVLIMV